MKLVEAQKYHVIDNLIQESVEALNPIFTDTENLFLILRIHDYFIINNQVFGY